MFFLLDPGLARMGASEGTRYEVMNVGAFYLADQIREVLQIGRGTDWLLGGDGLRPE